MIMKRCGQHPAAPRTQMTELGKVLVRLSFLIKMFMAPKCDGRSSHSGSDGGSVHCSSNIQTKAKMPACAVSRFARCTDKPAAHGLKS